MTDPLISLIIPTFNNPQYLYPCVESILKNTATPGLVKICVVNNGNPESVRGLPKEVDVLQMSSNKNWCGGLQAGVEATKSPFVLFCNDDIFIPASSRLWANQMLQHFVHADCAAVGPSSNFVMGLQAIWTHPGPAIFRVPFLIGFFMLLRRDALLAAGGIDPSFTCGDDLDLSLRLRKAGKYLVADKEVFIYHHGAKTGPRVEGSYWYSAEQQMKTWNMLFQKHGVRETYEKIMIPFDYVKYARDLYPSADVEGDLARSFIEGEKIVELGCGGKKTVPEAIGVDIIPRGMRIPGIGEVIYSVSDVVSDVQEKLPFEPSSVDCVIARHILEHTLNPVKTIKNWGEILKHGGRLIIAVPDQSVCRSIPMNPEHVAAYTPESLSDLMRVLGWKKIDVRPSGNNISMVGVFEKDGNS